MSSLGGVLFNAGIAHNATGHVITTYGRC